ncbi:MAG: histidine kinase [Bacteroidia bacterium]|nr:histidine kinase [Bacteroidia bacterium]
MKVEMIPSFKYQLLFSLFFFTFSLIAQLPEPCVRFSFNKGDSTDEITGHKAEFHSVNFSSDRFGNDNHAVYFYGNEQSYMSLGSYKELKPAKGSISLWVKVEHPIMIGNGVHYNPIILTRNTKLLDFYEAYSMYYLLDTKKFMAVCALDSTKDLGLYSKKPISMNEWKHLVLTYSDSSVAFYVNTELQVKFHLNFKMTFLEEDPVLVAATLNPKNNRWLNGTVDDIEVYSYPLSQAEIISLYNAPNPNRSAVIRNWILVGFGIVLLLVGIYFFIRRQLKKSFEKQRIALEQTNVLIETELRVNRALMNPHFVFNALNALQNLILNNQNDRANDYLVKFSKMIRKLLESNMSDVITIEVETELLSRYLEIENLRFEENILYTIRVDPSVSAAKVQIPVMMIQPFVENAIWHGLLKKQGEKRLDISFTSVEEKYILCVIDDNGLGKKRVKRKSSAVFDKTSLATSFIEQRLRLFNQIMKLKCYLSLEYKPDNKGTIFKILLPILKQ